MISCHLILDKVNMSRPVVICELEMCIYKGPSTRDNFVVHNLLCATFLIMWKGKSSENQSCTTSRNVVHDLEKSRPMFYFGTTNSMTGVKTTNHTAYLVAMTTRYDVVFYLRLLGGKINCSNSTQIFLLV